MTLKESLYTSRLPDALRQRVWKYALKKAIGRRYSDEEKESNLALRIIAKSDARVGRVEDAGITWDLTKFGVRLHPQARRYPSSDLGIMYQVLCKDEYGPAVEILRRRQSAGPVNILDAGANAGYASMYFKAAFPDCKLISLEIEPSNFEQLSRNLAGWKDVKLERLALWKRQAFLTIATDFRDGTECSYYPVESQAPTALQGFPLRHFVDAAGWRRIDLLKIDIEGSERFLFESVELADGLLSLTDLVAIEIHDEFDVRPRIYSCLERAGFTHFEHGDLTIACK